MLDEMIVYPKFAILWKIYLVIFIFEFMMLINFPLWSMYYDVLDFIGRKNKVEYEVVQ